LAAKAAITSGCVETRIPQTDPWDLYAIAGARAWLKETMRGSERDYLIGSWIAEVKSGSGVLGATEPKAALRRSVFLNTRSDFLIVAVVPALLTTPSAALGDLASSALVAARPTRGDDVLEDHGGSILCPVRVIRYQAEGIQVGCDSFQHTDHQRSVESNKLRSETRASKSPFGVADTQSLPTP
jgi:hypothetical protein